MVTNTTHEMWFNEGYRHDGVDLVDCVSSFERRVRFGIVHKGQLGL
jgi:hypothetical protein